MKYHLIDNQLFIKNRAKFVAQMKPHSVAVFNSNDIYPVSADSTLPFAQHRDIFYLSGVDQEESILLLFPDAPYPEHREMLFLRETNEHIAVWEGEKLTKEAAQQVSGIQTIHWLQDFHKILNEMMTYSEIMYINTNEHYRAAVATETREARFVKWWKEAYPAHQVAKSNPILQRIRSVKEPEELALIQTACNITEKGFRRLLSFVKPNVMEYEIEAELIHEFVRNRSKGFAYTPIIASGKNANVLHYIENNQPCLAGDLILLDVAAEYANYSSDLTRTIPVSGRYTDRQKAVYNAVLKVKNEATNLLQPGVLWKEYHLEVGKIMTSELLGLGLLDKADVQNENPEKPAYKKYFMHGTSHHLGLDTHDYGLLHEPIKPHMVFTVEPGIYIPEEGFGIRLEDNVVVQEHGNPFNLMQNIPIEIQEIEHLMHA
ncbi:peptidase M24 family protein [Flavobacterium branchiophilum NBRC 15030 = ATCC 35035]|uniref:Xaa-Pro aminopeptidase n=2 Tax=Flavobacterium branchiophilum TaxID=55197 RepID=G2Z6D9_FLABF|nr:aminopeptidase P family protein [Flavobacterium branchiophilum]OXA80841.1 peptidase M24 family protein [Flavobacterium branchiophilum NBRC 15030 = ATCC 35035]PDS23401.1 peptidase M24 family protein [Flavobacterium branchiophilum]TQM40372.1 Xaa-Pro aminopeptidase [Flavobacterium branchiophilum]CCB70959.1 Xaa-Pro aminopeptidase [Flavobacterium branchiophilum FL-15]GEM54454.1 Xaa-Pro aminopeptidase [Flavobacterium branchiophilum NBRC 15030 = ATCC 35035]